MHEYSLACEIFDTVISTAYDNKALSVNSITLKIGSLTHVNPDQLLFCLEVLSRDSIAEDAAVNVNFVSPCIECECGYRKDPVVSEKDRIGDQASIYEYGVMVCPECGKLLNFKGGDDLIVQTIDIEI